MADALKEELAKRITDRRVAIVVGAGVSLCAAKGAECASWRGLIASGIKKCEQLDLGTSTWANEQRRRLRKKNDVSELLRIGDDVSSRLGWDPDLKVCGGDWNGWLFDAIGQLHPNATGRSLIKAISGLNTLLVTLNYDNLLTEVTGRSPLTWQKAAQWLPVLEGKDPSDSAPARSLA